MNKHIKSVGSTNNLICGKHIISPKSKNTTYKLGKKEYLWYIPKNMRRLNIKKGDFVLAESKNRLVPIYVCYSFHEKVKEDKKYSAIKKKIMWCKGFGILPKLIMMDKDLSISAKSLYAYIISLAEHRNIISVDRDEIIRNLNINKGLYNKCLNQLIEENYIELLEKPELNVYKYKVVSAPKKYLSKDNKYYKFVSKGSMSFFGYGRIPQIIMKDKNIPIKAKSLYAYFVVFAGAGTIVKPKLEKVFEHLDISNEIFIKYIKVLSEYKYLDVVNLKENGIPKGTAYKLHKQIFLDVENNK